MEHLTGPFTTDALDDARTKTLAAFDSGADVVYQGTFSDGEFFGYADFVERAEDGWRVCDAKLARSAKPVRKSDTVILAAMEEEEGDRSEPEATEIVSRPSTGRGKFAINVGRFKTKAEAEQLLLRLALQESAVLDSASAPVPARSARRFM